MTHQRRATGRQPRPPDRSIQFIPRNIHLLFRHPTMIEVNPLLNDSNKEMAVRGLLSRTRSILIILLAPLLFASVAAAQLPPTITYSGSQPVGAWGTVSYSVTKRQGYCAAPTTRDPHNSLSSRTTSTARSCSILPVISPSLAAEPLTWLRSLCSATCA